MIGELNWIFTAITDTIAWNILPRGQNFDFICLFNCTSIIVTFYPPHVGEGGFESRQDSVQRHIFFWAQKLLVNFF